MKILTVGGFLQGQPTASLGADSAMLRENEPLFAPDDLDRFHSLIMPAVRISRLGCGISKRHAAAYCESLGAFHVLTPCDNSTHVDGIPLGAADRTFAPGHWQPFDLCFEKTIVLRASSAPIGSAPTTEAIVEFTPQTLAVSAIISWLSSAITFKTGDIILFADYSINLGMPVLNTEINADIDGIATLNFRIK